MGARRAREERKRRRRRTSGRTPKWLVTAADLDAIAQRRCLMLLSVLSGEKSVEEACREAEVSSAMYYQLEKKALTAMLASLVPGAGKDGSAAPHVKQLEMRVLQLERECRRSERLLFLTRRVVKPGPATTGKRGRPKVAPSSTSAGRSRSPASPRTRKKKKSVMDPASTLTPGGVDGS